MKKGIHPEYKNMVISCACGMSFEIRSTYSKAKALRLEICSNCHPFFTGKQKFVDTAGKVERFKERYKKRAS